MNFLIQRFPNSRPIAVLIDRMKHFESALTRCWRDENLESTVHPRREAKESCGPDGLALKTKMFRVKRIQVKITRTRRFQMEMFLVKIHLASTLVTEKKLSATCPNWRKMTAYREYRVPSVVNSNVMMGARLNPLFDASERR